MFKISNEIHHIKIRFFYVDDIIITRAVCRQHAVKKSNKKQGPICSCLKLPNKPTGPEQSCEWSRLTLYVLPGIVGTSDLF